MIYRLILLLALWCSTAHALVFGPIMASSTTYAPSAPVSVSGAAGNGQVVVSWSAGTVDGTHSAATSFNLWRGTSSGGTSLWQSGVTSPYTDTASNGTGYYYKVEAVNSAGNTLSTVAGPYTPTATVYAPNIPVIGTATAGNAQASVAFTASVVDGTHSAATSYTATSSPGGLTATGASSPLTVTGLTNGTAYTFTVTATNSAGTSGASSASNSVTPAGYVFSDEFAGTNGDAYNSTNWQAAKVQTDGTVTSGSTVNIQGNALKFHQAYATGTYYGSHLVTQNSYAYSGLTSVEVSVTGQYSVTGYQENLINIYGSDCTITSTGGVDKDWVQLRIGKGTTSGNSLYITGQNQAGTVNNMTLLDNVATDNTNPHVYKLVFTDSTHIGVYKDGSLVGTYTHSVTWGTNVRFGMTYYTIGAGANTFNDFSVDYFRVQ